MIPILIVSNDPKSIQDYVDNLKKDSLFIEVTPSTKEYSIDDIKNIARETKVFYQKIRIYFLPNFHLSSPPAQNSFLKLLEEPPTNVQFILTTDNRNNILPTLTSRTKIVKLSANKRFALNKKLATDLENLIDKHDLKIINQPTFSQIKRDEALEIFNQMIYFFKERLGNDKMAPQILKELMRVNGLLLNNNLNPQLSVDQTLIFIWKQYKMK